MQILTEGNRRAEFLISEANDWRSRDEVTISVPANTTYKSGTPLGVVTADGSVVPHDADASDGSETPAGVLYDTLTNETDSAVDMRTVNVARDAEVNRHEIVYADGADDAAKTAVNNGLAALGIIVR